MEHFHFARDRRRFVVSRGVLRAILGYYLAVGPNRLEFRYNEYGKPYLADKYGGCLLQFNVAHSQELVLYAFTRDREIGIDIEYIRPISDTEQIAKRFFSIEENTALQTIPTHLKLEAFFTCWTRKEAYIKAKGRGLSMPLDQFDVSVTPGERAELLSTRPDPQEANRWTLQALLPGQGYVGAVAVGGRDLQIQCCDWFPKPVTPGLSHGS